MFNLIFNYLIIFILVLGVTIGFFTSKLKFNDKKSIVLVLITSLLLFLVLFFSKNCFNLFNFLEEYMYVLFFTIAIVLFVMDLIFVSLNSKSKFSNKIDNKLFLVIAIILLLISSLMISSQYEVLGLFDMLLAIVVFAISFIASFQISKLLKYGKRPFYLIVSEYIILETILIVILALTYTSAKNLDWTMFSPYLILTPTYLVVYTIIAIIGIMVIGVYLNERKLKRE